MQCHRGTARVIMLHSYTGKTGIHIQQHADAYRDLQRLTEADRDSQRNAGSCIEMHRQLGRQRQAETGRDKQRYIQRYIQVETDIVRVGIQTVPYMQRQRYIQICTQVETEIVREWHVEARRYTDSAIQVQTESYCCIVTQERQADTDSNMQMQTETCRD